MTACRESSVPTLRMGDRWRVKYSAAETDDGTRTFDALGALVIRGSATPIAGGEQSGEAMRCCCAWLAVAWIVSARQAWWDVIVAIAWNPEV